MQSNCFMYSRIVKGQCFEPGHLKVATPGEYHGRSCNNLPRYLKNSVLQEFKILYYVSLTMFSYFFQSNCRL